MVVNWVKINCVVYSGQWFHQENFHTVTNKKILQILQLHLGSYECLLSFLSLNVDIHCSSTWIIFLFYFFDVHPTQTLKPPPFDCYSHKLGSKIWKRIADFITQQTHDDDVETTLSTSYRLLIDVGTTSCVY